MRRAWFTLCLILILTAWGGQGYHGPGTSPACGQPPPYYPPPPYNNPYYYPPPSNYYNYYSAPYTDPLSQFLYYVAPQIGEEWEEGQEEREYRRREGYEHRGHEGEGEHRGHGREYH
jgi:hypothetical protein